MNALSLIVNICWIINYKLIIKGIRVKNFKKFALTLVCTAVLSACNGDDGKDGAAGTAGAAGPQGEQGVAGQNGVTNYVTAEDVVKTNAQHAYAVFADSLIAA